MPEKVRFQGTDLACSSAQPGYPVKDLETYARPSHRVHDLWCQLPMKVCSASLCGDFSSRFSTTSNLVWHKCLYKIKDPSLRGLISLDMLHAHFSFGSSCLPIALEAYWPLSCILPRAENLSLSEWRSTFHSFLSLPSPLYFLPQPHFQQIWVFHDNDRNIRDTSASIPNTRQSNTKQTTCLHGWKSEKIEIGISQ